MSSLQQAGIDHLLLDVVELAPGHVAATKTVGHAGEPRHPTDGAGLASTQGALAMPEEKQSLLELGRAGSRLARGADQVFDGL
jgi:hypothetical protein